MIYIGIDRKVRRQVIKYGHHRKVGITKEIEGDKNPRSEGRIANPKLIRSGRLLFVSGRAENGQSICYVGVCENGMSWGDWV